MKKHYILVTFALLLVFGIASCTLTRVNTQKYTNLDLRRKLAEKRVAPTKLAWYQTGDISPDGLGVTQETIYEGHRAALVAFNCKISRYNFRGEAQREGEAFVQELVDVMRFVFLTKMREHSGLNIIRLEEVAASEIYQELPYRPIPKAFNIGPAYEIERIFMASGMKYFTPQLATRGITGAQRHKFNLIGEDSMKLAADLNVDFVMMADNLISVERSVKNDGLERESRVKYEGLRVFLYHRDVNDISWSGETIGDFRAGKAKMGKGEMPDSLLKDWDWPNVSVDQPFMYKHLLEPYELMVDLIALKLASERQV